MPKEIEGSPHPVSRKSGNCGSAEALNRENLDLLLDMSTGYRMLSASESHHQKTQYEKWGLE